MKIRTCTVKWFCMSNLLSWSPSFAGFFFRQVFFRFKSLSTYISCNGDDSSLKKRLDRQVYTSIWHVPGKKTHKNLLYHVVKKWFHDLSWVLWSTEIIRVDTICFQLLGFKCYISECWSLLETHSYQKQMLASQKILFNGK